jgi:hypothetical protein
MNEVFKAFSREETDRCFFLHYYGNTESGNTICTQLSVAGLPVVTATSRPFRKGTYH